MISVKDRTVLRSLLIVAFDPMLIDIMLWLDATWPDRLVITSGYREGDIGSVHSTKPCRGIDIRSWVYDDPYAVAKSINKRWEYDPSRSEKKVALLHDTGRGWHFHIQVCNKTQRRK